MGNEISLRLSVQVQKGTMQKITIAPSLQQIDMTGVYYIYQIQNIGTAAENLLKGDITTPGYLVVHNMDATNFVEIGYDDTGFKNVVKLLADEWVVFRAAQATLQAKADTAACDIEYLMIEA